MADTTHPGPRLRFAVVGCGHIGQAHIRALRQLEDRAELVAVADVVPERAAAFAKDYGVDAISCLEETLARPDIDAVTLGTPSGLHGDQLIKALEAGKHVIVEKPLDVSVDVAKRMLEAERRSDRTAMVVSQMRYAPASQAVHNAARSGAFGNLTSGTVTMPWWRSQSYYDSGDWRGTWAMDGGGALMNQAIHVIDLFRWFLGTPVEVYAWSGQLAHERIEVEDTAVAVVRFENGALGTVHGSTAAYPGASRRIQVHGDRGSAIMDDTRLSYFHSAGADATDMPYGSRGEENQAAQILPDQHELPSRRPAADPTDPSMTSHAVQFRDFIDAVEEARSPLVTLTEGAKTLALIQAIYESARAGQPVKVSDPTQL
jgi:predicted dehydrogenase